MKKSLSRCIFTFFLLFLLSSCSACSSGYDNETDNTSDYTTDTNDTEIIVPTATPQMTAIEKLEALGIKIACMGERPIQILGCVLSPRPSYGFVRIPDIPFGIYDEEQLEILIEARYEANDMLGYYDLLANGGIRIDGISFSLHERGLLDTLESMAGIDPPAGIRSERVLNLVSQDHYIIRRDSEVRQAEEAFADVWLSLVGADYVEMLNILGLELDFVYIRGSGAMRKIPHIVRMSESPGIVEEDLAVLLDVLWRLIDMGFTVINMEDAVYQPAADELWLVFADMTQQRWMDRLLEFEPYIAHLEALGLKIELVFPDPTARHPVAFPQWVYYAGSGRGDQEVRFQASTIYGVPFGITSRADIELFLDVFFRLGAGYGDVRMFNISMPGIASAFDAIGLFDEFYMVFAEMQNRFWIYDITMREQRLVEWERLLTE